MKIIILSFLISFAVAHTIESQELVSESEDYLHWPLSEMLEINNEYWYYGIVNKSFEGNHYEHVFYRVNEDFVITDSVVFDTESTYGVYNIVLLDQYILVSGILISASNYSNHKLLLLDTDFNLLDSLYLPFSDYLRGITLMNYTTLDSNRCLSTMSTYSQKDFQSDLEIGFHFLSYVVRGDSLSLDHQIYKRWINDIFVTDHDSIVFGSSVEHYDRRTKEKINDYFLFDGPEDDDHMIRATNKSRLSKYENDEITYSIITSTRGSAFESRFQPYILTYNLKTLKHKLTKVGNEEHNMIAHKNPMVWEGENAYFCAQNNTSFYYNPTVDNSTISIFKFDNNLDSCGEIKLIFEDQYITPFNISLFYNSLILSARYAINASFADQKYYTFRIPLDLFNNCIGSITPVFQHDALDFFPNPASEVINIGEALSYERIMIYNMQGALVRTIDSPEAEIYIGDLPKGTYQIIAQQGQTFFAGELMKL